METMKNWKMELTARGKNFWRGARGCNTLIITIGNYNAANLLHTLEVQWRQQIHKFPRKKR